MEPRDRIVNALATPDGALRRAGVELVIDHLLSQPLARFVDLDAIMEILVVALSRDNAARTLERHVVPGIARVLTALRDAGERVGDAVPEDAHARLDQLVTRPSGPRFAWLRGALDRDKLRALLAPAFQEMFVSFASRIPLAGSGGASAVTAVGGLVGSLGRGATERLRSIGKSVADGLGVDIEAKLRDAARDASQNAVSGLERAITARLSTPEGSALVAGLSRSVLEHVLETPMSTIVDDLDRLPLADAFRLAPPIVAHDLARKLWRDIVQSELRAALELDGARSLRELLEEAQLLARVRSQLVTRLDPVLGELFQSPAFASFLDRLLTS